MSDDPERGLNLPVSLDGPQRPLSSLTIELRPEEMGLDSFLTVSLLLAPPPLIDFFFSMLIWRELLS